MAFRPKSPTPPLNLMAALEKGWPKGFDTGSMSFPDPADAAENDSDLAINDVMSDRAQEHGAVHHQGPEAARFRLPDPAAPYRNKKTGEPKVSPVINDKRLQQERRITAAGVYNLTPGKEALEARRQAGVVFTGGREPADFVGRSDYTNRDSDPAGSWGGPRQRWAQDSDRRFWTDVDSRSQPSVPHFVDPKSGVNYEFSWGHPLDHEHLGRARRLRVYARNPEDAEDNGYMVAYHDIGPQGVQFYPTTRDPGHDFNAIDTHVQSWLAANPLARSEAPDYTRWLAQQPLRKSVDPDHLKAVARYSDQPTGRIHVDDSQEHGAHPAHHEAEVQLFRSKVLDNPEPVSRARFAVGESGRGAVTGKAVYDVKDHQGKSNRYMIKAYHEKLVPKAKNWMAHPIQGWAEMTNQHLYHSAGIGDLHQRVHVATVPLGPDREPSRALVIHMTAGAHPVHQLDDRFWDFGPYKNQARKLALMDFLSNNLDRHGNNLLFDQDQGNLLAIDHSRSFQYANNNKFSPRHHPDETEPDQDFIGNYLGSGDDPTGTGTVIGPRPRLDYGAEHQASQKAIDAWNDGWYPAFDWWGKHRENIRAAMEDRLPLLRDPAVRRHVRRNFMARWAHLNDLADAGHETRGRLDWENQPVDLYQPGFLDRKAA